MVEDPTRFEHVDLVGLAPDREEVRPVVCWLAVLKAYLTRIMYAVMTPVSPLLAGVGAEALAVSRWRPEAVEAFLREARMASLATLRPDGTPTAQPIWFEWRDGQATVFTATSSGKVGRIRANLQRDPSGARARCRVRSSHEDMGMLAG